MQHGLLDYRAPKNAPDRSATTAGLSAGVRIAVRRNSVRAADRGTITDVFEDRAIVRYRSDRNGGSYDVELERVKILKRPKARAAKASTTNAEG